MNVQTVKRSLRNMRDAGRLSAQLPMMATVIRMAEDGELNIHTGRYLISLGLFKFACSLEGIDPHALKGDIDHNSLESIQARLVVLIGDSTISDSATTNPVYFELDDRVPSGPYHRNLIDLYCHKLIEAAGNRGLNPQDLPTCPFFHTIGLTAEG